MMASTMFCEGRDSLLTSSAGCRIFVQRNNARSAVAVQETEQDEDGASQDGGHALPEQQRVALDQGRRRRVEVSRVRAAKIEDIGLLLVHGIGEQKRLEHLRCTAGDIASYVAETPNLHRLSVNDVSDSEGLIVIDVQFADDGGTERHVRLNCREVWWADLGASGGLGAQVLFWFWGLGQWAAEVKFIGKSLSNTTELMYVPHFKGDTPGKPPGYRRQWLARIILYFAGVLALLTLFTWSLVKRIVTFVAGKIPDTSIIFLFLGDVKAYQQPGGPGRGTPEDPNMPRRATIRRRMVTQMIEVGEESGQISQMLDKVADFYDREVDSAADSLTASIEPIMVLVMGAVVGGMVICLYLPMFTIYQNIQSN